MPVGFYGALWTRDCAYLVQNVFDLLQPRRAIVYLLHSVACLIVCRYGTAVYSAGHPDTPLAIAHRQLLNDGQPSSCNRPAILNSPARTWSHCDGHLTSRLAVRRACNPSGPPLWIHRHSGQNGRSASSCFTGRPARRWRSYVNNAMRTPLYTERAADIEHVGRSALLGCNQIDIWGSAFAVYIDFMHGQRRQRLLSFLRDRYQDYVWRGQVRHLLRGEYWARLLTTLSSGIPTRTALIGRPPLSLRLGLDRCRSGARMLAT